MSYPFSLQAGPFPWRLPVFVPVVSLSASASLREMGKQVLARESTGMDANWRTLDQGYGLGLIRVDWRY